MAEQHAHILTPTCASCHSAHTVKDGHVRGYPRRRCQACGRRYQRTSPRGYPKEVQHQALKLYASGLSMNRTGQIVGVSVPTVLRWVREAGQRVEQHLPSKTVVSVEADEMHHFVEKRPKSCGCSKPSMR